MKSKTVILTEKVFFFFFEFRIRCYIAYLYMLTFHTVYRLLAAMDTH